MPVLVMVLVMVSSNAEVDEFILKTMADWVAAGKKKVFVVGEGQASIGKYIRENLAGESLEFRKIWPESLRFKIDSVTGLLLTADEVALIEFNQHLLRRLYERGFTFIDIGRDGRTIASTFYGAELQVLREIRAEVSKRARQHPVLEY